MMSYLKNFLVQTLCLISFLSVGSSLSWAQEFRTGCVLDPVLYEQVPLSAPLMRGDYRQLPHRVSLRPYAPIPQNQGSYGTCVGWSTAYAARTIMMAHEQNWTNTMLITENAFSPFFIYEQAKSISDIYCQEGTSLYNALEIIKEIGAVKISEFGSQCGQTVTTRLEEKAKKFKIQNYKRIFDSSAPDKVTLAKKSLAENKPIIIGMQCCTESFLNAKGKTFWELQPSDNPNPNGGHALTVIGYDDEKFGGAFELMNSWGTTWGKEGFIWFSYDDFERYCFEAYEMTAGVTEMNQLAGEVHLNLSAGEEMKTYYKGRGTYETVNPYHSGTLFRMYISNEAPAYVYAFGSDLSKQNYKVFPHHDGISAYLGYKANNIAIPNEDYFVQLDNRVGTDYFCVLYSAERLNLDQIFLKMEQAEGDFRERLDQALGSKLVTAQEVSYDINGQISFKGISRTRSVVPLIISINHIE